MSIALGPQQHSFASQLRKSLTTILCLLTIEVRFSSREMSSAEVNGTHTGMVAQSEQLSTLRWEGEGEDEVPAWAVNPSINKIENLARLHLSAFIGADDAIVIEPFAEGALNKLFKISTTQRPSTNTPELPLSLVDAINSLNISDRLIGAYISLSNSIRSRLGADQTSNPADSPTSPSNWLMRVTLPVCPSLKTSSEVATLNYVRQVLSTNIPEVLAYSASADNSLRFEWQIQTVVAGRPLRKVWRAMSMEKKEGLTKVIAYTQSRLLGPEHRFDAIGSLYFQEVNGEVDNNDHSTVKDSKSVFRLGRMVSPEFYCGSQLDATIQRGPYPSSSSWFEDRLILKSTQAETACSSAEDEDDIEIALSAAQLADRIRTSLPTLIPPGQDTLQTGLWHHDLNMSNILIDDDGNLTGIVDWENISARPLWCTTDYPEYLNNFTVREKRPDPEDYPEADETDGSDGLETYGKNDIYWEHQLDWEVTQLRKVFQAEIKRLCPWVEEASYRRMSDIDLAIQLIGSSMWNHNHITRWLDEIESGKEESSLADILLEQRADID